MAVSPMFPQQSGGLQMLYSALSYRQAEKLRQEQEAERKRQQEEARRQQEAANKHNAFSSTLQALGTVGGAIAGSTLGPGAGTFAGAALGASLGNAAASGIMAIAPNIAGTQPATDNPYYNAPSDTQRALTALNSGLQIGSAYETSLKEKWLKSNDLAMRKETARLTQAGKVNDALALTDAGDGENLAKIWDSVGVSSADLPWFISESELNALASEEYIRLSDQIFPAIEMRQLEADFQGVNLVTAAGGTSQALELLAPVLEAKGDQSKIQTYLETLSPAQREAIESLATNQPYFIQAQAYKNIYTLAGQNAKELKAKQAEIAKKGAEKFNAEATKAKDKVVKMYNSVMYGGSDFDMGKSVAIKDQLNKLGILDPEKLTPEEFVIVYEMTQGENQELMAAALAQNFGDQNRVQQAFEKLSEINPKYAGTAALYTEIANNPDYIPQALGGTLQTSPASGPQSNTTTALGSSVSAGTQDSESSAKRVDDPASPSLQLTYNQEADFSGTDPSTKYASQNDTATLVVPDTLENQAAGTEISDKAAEELADQNVLAQAQGANALASPMNLSQIYQAAAPPAPTGVAPQNIAGSFDSNQQALDQMAPQFEGGPAAIRTEQDVARLQANREARQTNAVPGGGTQNPATGIETNPVPIRRAGTLETGRPIYQDQLGRSYSEMPEVLEVMGYGFVVTPTVDAQTGQVRDIEQVSSLVMDSIETKGAPFDPDTNQQLPTFATREEAELFKNNRKEDIGETVPSESTYQRNRDRAIGEPFDAREQMNELIRQGRENPIPEYVGTPAAPTNATLRNLIENSAGKFQPIDTPTTAERVDRDIANAQIQRAAGPDMQRLEAEQENINRQQGEELERGFEAYLKNRRNQMAQQAREQQQLANEKATPIVDERLNRPPVSPAQDDISDRGTSVRVPNYLKNTTFDELSQDEYDKLPANQKPLVPPNRVALPVEAVKEREEPQANLRKALKAEGLEDMAGVARDIIQLESGGDEDATNRMGSSAYGLFQLTDETFKRYAPSGAKRGNQKAELAAAVAMLKDNKEYLERNEYLPTFTNVYVLHHFGKGGINLLMADPDDLITDVMYTNSNTGKRTKLIDAGTLAQNPWLNSTMTVGEMLDAIKDAKERGQFGKAGAA